MVVHGVEPVKKTYLLMVFKSGEILDAGAGRKNFNAERTLHQNIMQFLFSGKKVVQVMSRGETEHDINIC